MLKSIRLDISGQRTYEEWLYVQRLIFLQEKHGGRSMQSTAVQRNQTHRQPPLLVRVASPSLAQSRHPNRIVAKTILEHWHSTPHACLQAMMCYMNTCARPLELTPAKTSRDGWKTTTLWMEVITSPPVTSTAEGFFPAPLSPLTLYRCTWDRGR